MSRSLLRVSGRQISTVTLLVSRTASIGSIARNRDEGPCTLKLQQDLVRLCVAQYKEPSVECPLALLSRSLARPPPLVSLAIRVASVYSPCPPKRPGANGSTEKRAILTDQPVYKELRDSTTKNYSHSYGDG